MKSIVHQRCLLLLVLSIVVSCTYSSVAWPAKLLRGEHWRPFAANSVKADFYVSPAGNDRWSGTLSRPNAERTDGPFATIDRARTAVRALKERVYRAKSVPIEKRYIGSPHPFGQGRDILVLIRGGYYVLAEPLEFTPEDGGARCETDLPSGAFEYHKLKDYYVTYAAYPGETPILGGGPKITAWQQTAPGLWKATIKGVHVRKLVANGRLQTLARTPNQGYFTPATPPQSTQSFTFRAGQLRSWPHMKGNRLVFLLRWHQAVNALVKVDEERHVATLRKPQKGIVVVPPRYYVENVRALLDAPGEWFFDRRANELFYRPSADVGDPRRATLVAPLVDRLFVLRGAPTRPLRNLRIYGLTFEATRAGGDAVSMTGAHGCELVDCTIRAVAGAAVGVGKGCYQVRILRNTIRGADRGGIAVRGKPYPETTRDIIRETIISYNQIDDCGGRSIAASNCLNTVISHNQVAHNRGRTAISVGGWANLEEAIDGGYRVQYNHVHHVQSRADDSGAITTAGMTCDGLVRGNLIHDVAGSFFNENVAIWFDNMSSGWRAEDNIYYHLDQGAMKLCAANLVDNTYRDNFLIDAPRHPPEGIIDGAPDFRYTALTVSRAPAAGGGANPRTGEPITAAATVRNDGASGVAPVALYVDGMVAQRRKFAVIRGNSRPIRFAVRCPRPGRHRIAIGSTAERVVTVQGPPLAVLWDSPTGFARSVPLGTEVTVRARVQSVVDRSREITAALLIDGKEVAHKSIRLGARESRQVEFLARPPAGTHTVRVGASAPARIRVYVPVAVPMDTARFAQYCSATARPCTLRVDPGNRRFHLTVAGTDFLHGEDSYGAIYLPHAARGDFVATVQIVRFGPRTHEWFRAGLFVRNDMTASYDTGHGSPGSVLLFATPARCGMNWDEHGDGRAERAASANRGPHDSAGCVYLKLVRHGNRFSGYQSKDGEAWLLVHETPAVPKLAETLDIGIAAGGPDQRRYEVELADFSLAVEKPPAGAPRPANRTAPGAPPCAAGASATGAGRPGNPVARSAAQAKTTPQPGAGAPKQTKQGALLYNGIRLPATWPPRRDRLPDQPVMPPYLVTPPTVIPIDLGRQLFVDDFLVERTTLRRVYHRPEYYAGNPILTPDKPWERTGRGPMAIPHSGGVCFDPADQRFKLWYITGYQQGVGLVYSQDGLHWKRPVFDHVQPGTNMVIDAASRGSTIWLDSEATDPARRFVMFSSRPGAVWFSRDGIHWGAPIKVAGPMSDRTTLFWNPFRKVWVYSIKTMYQGKRARRYWETPQLVGHRKSRWDTVDEPTLWTGADAADPPRDDMRVPCQLYDLDCVAYESILLGSFIIWRGDYRFNSTTPAARRDNKLGRPKQNSACIGFSRDGFHWYRPDRREFLPKPDTPGAWNWGNSQTAAMSPLVVGDKLYFYVAGRGGRPFPGNTYQDAGGSTGVAMLRRDGFASMDAGPEGGTLTTRPVVFTGKYLMVNVDNPSGSLRVEILGPDGRPIGPFSRDNCVPVTTGKTLHPVAWKNARDLSAVAGRPVRLRFHLTNGRLYAFWVSRNRSGVSGGYVGGGGPGFPGNRDTL